MHDNDNVIYVNKLTLIRVIKLDRAQLYTPVRELMQSTRKEDMLLVSCLNYAVNDESHLKAVVDFLREEGFLNSIFDHTNVFIMPLLRAAADYQAFYKWAQKQEQAAIQAA